MKWYRVIIPLITALFISGCAVFRPARELEITPADKVNKVRDLLAVLKTQNDSLKNFKGIGNIQIRQNGRLQLDQRVAWVGEKPVKLSIAVLISGYPAVKLATDGKWLYYLEVHGQNTTFQKFQASDPSLKKLISIPIASSDVITLLAGQIPMPEFDSASFIEENAKRGYVLVLKERWWGIRQKIYYDQSISEVRRVDVYHRSGSLKYRVEINGMQSVNGFQVPLQLRLLTLEGADCLLNIDRYWANVNPPPDVFVLTPPK
ncbi:MAG: hypothetical protein P8185_08505 [Deltaproteobacteria bacterium]|jgi:hypothetical protein